MFNVKYEKNIKITKIYFEFLVLHFKNVLSMYSSNLKTKK